MIKIPTSTLTTGEASSAMCEARPDPACFPLPLNRIVAPVLLLLITGSALQAYANDTGDTFFITFALLSLGSLIVNLISSRNSYEAQAFLLTYAICIFTAGIAQCYSLEIFHNPQSTVDAFKFIRVISPSPPFMTMENMPVFNSPLAILIWQQVYKVTWLLNLDFGPYIGTTFNAFVMGITGSLTVRTAREVFGDDSYRMRQVALLFAFCGLFIMFGAILLRDCFTIFLNTLVLWVLVRWLRLPNFKSFSVAIIVTCVSAYAMALLRIEAVILFGLFGLVAVGCWFVSKPLNAVRLVSAVVIFGILLISSAYLSKYTYLTQEIQGKGMAGYNDLSSETHSSDSLGMRLIVNQPLPVRVLIGSGALMLSPIPLWGFFKMDAGDSYWIKGYHGLFQVFVIPLVFAGIVIAIRTISINREKGICLLFLAAYLLLNMTAVVSTSMEQRHLAQFMPAFIILAALPDTRDAFSNKVLRRIRLWWFFGVFVVHVAWVALKG